MVRRKRGRIGILKEKNLTKEILVNTYKYYHNALLGSQVLKISYKTYRKYLKLYGIKLKAGNPLRTNRIHYSKFMKWYRKNKTKLPKSFAKISKLSNCSYDTVKSYFYRRRKEIKDFIQKLPDLTKTDLKLKLKNNRIFPFKYMLSYRITFNKWTFEIIVTSHMKSYSKPLIFKMNYKKFFKLFSPYLSELEQR